ncbi:MAG: DUF2061 domain-containing protein [Terriglobales bacterium]|jgi:uncharacterized membrane protein
MKERHGRSIAKALSWRISGTAITSALVFAFTGKWKLSLDIGILEFCTKSFAYYFHERVWSYVSWGKAAHPGDGNN